MKITKRQLKRIINEEAKKLQKEARTDPQAHRAARALGGLTFMFEDEISAQMSQLDRNWYTNPVIVKEVVMMLEELSKKLSMHASIER